MTLGDSELKVEDFKNSPLQDAVETFQKQYVEQLKKFQEFCDKHGITRCPHCEEVVKKSEVCYKCNKYWESGIEQCEDCNVEKIYNDTHQKWECPFCEK